jgi:hypothetical protein
MAKKRKLDFRKRIGRVGRGVTYDAQGQPTTEDAGVRGITSMEVAGNLRNAPDYEKQLDTLYPKKEKSR